MSTSRAALARKLYKFDRPNVLTSEGSHLPEAYKKFYREWKFTSPQPVHYIRPSSQWIRNEETGEVKRVSDQPIPLKFPPESHIGIWGGEAVIKGFQKRHDLKQRVAHWWVPNLKLGIVHSEILDKRLSVTITNRTIDLIIENHGFDHYILKTPACDLQSGLALKLKRAMLQKLSDRENLYPNDSEKEKDILAKYGHYLEQYTPEEIEWYGLTIDEALIKYNQEMEEENKPQALKHQFRQQYLEYLREEQMEKKEEQVESSEVDSRSWLNKINPFSR